MASACGLRTRDWDVSIADEWRTLRTALIACQNDPLASLRNGLADVNKRAAAVRAEEPDATVGEGDSATLVTTAVTDEVPAALLDALADSLSSHSGVVNTSDELTRPERLTELFETLSASLATLEKRLSAIRDDAALANVDLQNALQQQSRTFQTLSNVLKALHDVAMKSIQNVRA